MPNEAIVPLGADAGLGGRNITVVNHFHGLVIRDESDIDSLSNQMRGSLDGIR